jgi:hypothetical protein
MPVKLSFMLPVVLAISVIGCQKHSSVVPATPATKDSTKVDTVKPVSLYPYCDTFYGAYHLHSYDDPAMWDDSGHSSVFITHWGKDSIEIVANSIGKPQGTYYYGPDNTKIQAGMLDVHVDSFVCPYDFSLRMEWAKSHIDSYHFTLYADSIKCNFIQPAAACLEGSYTGIFKGYRKGKH